MIAYLVTQHGYADRIVCSDDVMPEVERTRLTRAGFKFSVCNYCRVRSAEDWNALVTPLLQVDLFA